MEAYEIGVTLALNDGVSVGIAQARKDMAQLEGVLQAGGVSVQQLRAASVNAFSAIRAVPAVQAGGAKEKAAPRQEPAETAARVEAAPPARALPAGAPGAGVVAKVTTGAPAPATRPSQAPVAPLSKEGPAGPTRLGGLVGAPEAAAPVAGSPVMAPGAQVARASLPALLQVSAPVSVTQSGAPADRVVRASVGAPVADGLARAASDVAQAPPSALPMPQKVGAPDIRVAPDAAQGGWAAATSVWQMPAVQLPDGQTAHRITGAAAALPRPYDASERSFSDPQGGGGGLPAAQSPAAPPASAAASAPTQGDVFLDGALVGRWMSKFLTREAGRASAGPTGFDPRRGRLLPGATVGG